ncbi:MAG: trypsin-like peptidase domain-containing protein, partial [Acidimicrobiia bacterium]|nr:trypsin-like peptidase domain-containing protein [Acidimicrobiia bacterium]
TTPATCTRASTTPATTTPASTSPATTTPVTTEPEVAPVTALAPAVLSAQEVYSLVAPSISLIKTPTGTGSGILIAGGYVVTNHHVVWPYEKVWVVFPDGTELGDVPVVRWDPYADLAVLGPVGVAASPVSLVNGEGMDPGSEVHLIGYPAETDLFPQPTITSGVLSRVREWDLIDLTLLQSDADIAGGQSGGALVNSSGDVVGISTWSFSDAGFSVSTSASDIAEVVRLMLLDHEEFGRLVPLYVDAFGAFEFAVELVNTWDAGLYWFEGTAGSTIEVAIDGPSDGRLAVVGPAGVVMVVDDTYEGRESGIVELPVDGPYLVFVGHAVGLGELSGRDLASSVELSPFYDPDDGQSLAIGESLGALIDYQWDIDWYELPLEQGDTVVVWTEAIATDTAVYIGYEGAGLDEWGWDDDSGPAVVGESTNAWLHYTAPISGTYQVVVQDVLGQSGGGYFVGVGRADPLDQPVASEDDGYGLRFEVGAGTTGENCSSPSIPRNRFASAVNSARAGFWKTCCLPRC